MAIFGRKKKQKRNPAAARSARSKQAAPVASGGRPPIIIADSDTRLTKAEKKRFAAAYKKAKRDGKIPRTVQQSIPYREIFPDGICQLDYKTFSKTVEFFDISYFLADEADKDHIFTSYCAFLNYFDPTISAQFSFINHMASLRERRKTVEMLRQQDGFNPDRAEFSGIIQRQIAGGGNRLVRRKFITFTVEAGNLREARARIEQVENDIIGNFKALGVTARPLSGLARLRALHAAFHPYGGDPLHFVWDGIVNTGLSTKDFIAPDSFHFGEARSFRMGAIHGAVSHLQIGAAELSDNLLAELLDLGGPAIINLHVRSIDHAEALKILKRKLSDLSRMKADEQKRAAQGGYDIDIRATRIAV